MKKDLIKFLKLFVLFVPVAAVIYVGLLLFWGSYMPQKLQKNLNYRIGSYGYMWTRIRDAQHTKDVDILFLGSSHAYRSFDTRIFQQAGYTSFNFGSSAQTPVQTEVLLHRYLDGLHPKMVVYEVYPGTFTADGTESALDIIANDKNDAESFYMATELRNVKVYNTLIYALFSEMTGKNKNFKENADREEDRYIPGGFVEKSLATYKYQDYGPKKRKWIINPVQVEAFDRIVKVLHDKNIPFILVQAPITPALYNSYKNNEEFDQRLAKYGKYYNFNEVLPLDDSLYFYDSHHMNSNGVKIFDSVLIATVIGRK